MIDNIRRSKLTQISQTKPIVSIQHMLKLDNATTSIAAGFGFSEPLFNLKSMEPPSLWTGITGITVTTAHARHIQLNDKFRSSI